MPQGHDTNPAEVFSEAEKLASLRHPCVMGFYGIVTSPDAYATVSEYICHGSLRGGLMKIKKKASARAGDGGSAVRTCSVSAGPAGPLYKGPQHPGLLGGCSLTRPRTAAHPGLPLTRLPARANAQGISDKRLRAYITLQAAHGMEYLHLNYMVHFDLKCDNLLCDLRDLNKPVVKIGDLGLSKLKKGSFVSGNMRGTLPW